MLEPGIHRAGTRWLEIDMFAFPVPGGFHTPEHLCARRQADIAVQVRAQPDRADLGRGDVHETMVVAGAGKPGNVRVQYMAIQLYAVILTFKKAPVFLREERESGFLRSHTQDHLVAGDGAAVFQVQRFPGEMGYLTMDRFYPPVRHQAKITSGRQRGRGAQVADELMLRDQGIQPGVCGPALERAPQLAEKYDLPGKEIPERVDQESQPAVNESL